MRTFNEVVYDTTVFENMDVSFLNDQELQEAIKLYHEVNLVVETEGLAGLETKIAEGFFGGLAGFLVGPTIGKIIANALGIERGILYDMLTSRLVSAALGSAIQKN